MDKILVVDDEKPTLDMFRLLLNAQGYTVLTAEDGRKGLDVFEREKPPLVITDIKMPGMDGIEVLKRVKQSDPNTEVIVITGHGDMDLAIKALNLDATDFINKPIQRQYLEQALKRAKERIDFHRSNENQTCIEIRENTAVMTLRGGVTSSSESHLQNAFEKALATGKDEILLVFDPNASINGAGISILTQLLLDARKQGRNVSIAGLSENFRRVFKIVGISSLVKVFDSEGSALSS